jgi:feruloyl esterase
MEGRAATQEFFRLFMVPGMQHCTNGDGAFAIDYLTYLEDWVERGQPPYQVIGAHVDSKYLQQMARHFLQQREIPDDGKPHEWAGAMTLSFPLASTVPVTFTRPIYPYPTQAKYAGHGDPNRAENFIADSAE